MNKFHISDSKSGSDKILISNKDQLRDFLYEKAKEGNCIVLLESSSSGTLTIGIGNLYGFVEYMNITNDPPYLIAVTDTSRNDINSFIEFNSGGTPTPIPVFACLPVDQVVNIALHFYDNEDLKKYAKWQEV